MFSQHATFQAQLGEICGAARRKIQPEPEVIGTGISLLTLKLVIGFFIIHQNVLLIIICRFRLGWKGTSSKACGQNLIWSFNFYCLPSIWADRHFIRKNFPTLLVCRIAISYPSIHIHIHIHIYEIYIISRTHTYIYTYTCVYSPQYVKRKRHLYPTLGKTTSWASFAHHFSMGQDSLEQPDDKAFPGKLGWLHLNWFVVWNIFFPYSGNNNPNWLDFSEEVETTN